MVHSWRSLEWPLLYVLFLSPLSLHDMTSDTPKISCRYCSFFLRTLCTNKKAFMETRPRNFLQFASGMNHCRIFFFLLGTVQCLFNRSSEEDGDWVATRHHTRAPRSLRRKENSYLRLCCERPKLHPANGGAGRRDIVTIGHQASGDITYCETSCSNEEVTIQTT